MIDLKALKALYEEAMPPGFNDQLYGILTKELVDAFPELVAELESLKGLLRRVELSNSKMGIRDRELDVLLNTFHTSKEYGQYECIGYSEGQQCCVSQLQEELTRQQKVSGG